MESITRPCKYELNVRIEVVLNEAFLTKAVLSSFCNNIPLQISDMAHYNHIPLLSTINVYKQVFKTKVPSLKKSCLLGSSFQFCHNDTL